MAQRLKKLSFLNVLLVLIFLSWCVSAQAQTNWCEDATCKGCWLMDVDEDPLTDTSGNGNTIALKGAGEPNFTAVGQFGGGYIFDGNNDFGLVTGGDGSDFDPGTALFSMVMWLDSTVSDGGGTDIPFMAGVGGADEYGILLSDSSNSVRAFANTDGSADADSGVDIRGAGFTHVAGIRSATRTTDIWVDGVFKATDSHAATESIDITSNLAIGMQVSGILHFHGTMDEVAYFLGKVLDIFDINDIMDNGLVQAATGRTRRMF